MKHAVCIYCNFISWNFI